MTDRTLRGNPRLVIDASKRRTYVRDWRRVTPSHTRSLPRGAAPTLMNSKVTKDLSGRLRGREARLTFRLVAVVNVNRQENTTSED